MGEPDGEGGELAFAGGVLAVVSPPVVLLGVVVLMVDGVPLAAAPVESLEDVDAVEELSPAGDDVSAFFAQPAIMTLEAARMAPAATRVERQGVVLMD